MYITQCITLPVLDPVTRQNAISEQQCIECTSSLVAPWANVLRPSLDLDMQRSTQWTYFPFLTGGSTIDSCTQVKRTFGLYQHLEVSSTLPKGCAPECDHQIRSLIESREMTFNGCTTSFTKNMTWQAQWNALAPAGHQLRSLWWVNTERMLSWSVAACFQDHTSLGHK